MYLTPNEKMKGKKSMKLKRTESPVKAVPWEDALGKPCLSFSFDEYFKLDSDQS